MLFDSFPPVLQLQLKRFEYDFQRDVMVKVRYFPAHALLFAVRQAQMRLHFACLNSGDTTWTPGSTHLQKDSAEPYILRSR